ncbi:hypothetical protein BHE74_00041650, partial [Ensete ventricosum]
IKVNPKHKSKGDSYTLHSVFRFDLSWGIDLIVRGATSVTPPRRGLCAGPPGLSQGGGAQGVFPSRINPYLNPTLWTATPPDRGKVGTLSITVTRLVSHPRGLTPCPPAPELDTLSSNSADSLRTQLHQVNQRLDEVQKEFVKSKEEIKESSKGGSPFALKMQDKPISINFCLPSLESCNDSSDSTEHVASVQAQMTLYDTLDALMCWTFLTTLRGLAQMWYSRLKPSMISSFNQFAKEFELNCLVSARPRPTTTSLLGLSQGSEEPLAQFVGHFAIEIQGVPDAHPSLMIQAFLIGL